MTNALMARYYCSTTLCVAFSFQVHLPMVYDIVIPKEFKRSSYKCEEIAHRNDSRYRDVIYIYI